MAFYLKKFEAMSQYDAYTADTENFIKPNVSLVVDNNTVRYNPILPETKLVVYYDIQDISSPTTIFTNYDGSVKSMEIDGTLLDSVVTAYQFDSVGEHVIKYEFNNPTMVGNNAPLFHNLTTIKSVVIPNTFTSIGSNAFMSCSGLTSIVMPDSITSIGNAVFYSCISLTSIVIPSGVTWIAQQVFQSCTGLTSITCNATTAPSILNDTFRDVKTGGTLTVPSGSSGYDTWMQNSNYYLGLYNWTKVEQ